MSHPGGRPLKFKSAAEITEKAERYFAEQRENDKPITVTGLCIALGTIRHTLDDYQSGKYDDKDPDFSTAIKKAKLICENYAEMRLYGNNPTGAIFALKNFGWTDKVQNEVMGKDGGPIQAAITVEFVKPANGDSSPS